MGGTPDIEVPGPTPEEKDLMAQQTALLKQQTELIAQGKREQDLLAPILFKSLGINPKMDETGKIIGFEEIPSELVDKRQESERLLLDRSIAALKGELPLNPGLLADVNASEETLKETLRRTLGPDYAASTPGSTALSQFAERKASILDAARRGDITLAESLSLSREESNRARDMARLAGGTGLTGGAAINFGEATGSAARGYGLPLSILQGDRQLALQGNIARAQYGSSTTSNILQGIFGLGKLGGQIMSGPSSGTIFSDLFA